jgi:hypothetical protein
MWFGRREDVVWRLEFWQGLWFGDTKMWFGKVSFGKGFGSENVRM